MTTIAEPATTRPSRFPAAIEPPARPIAHVKAPTLLFRTSTGVGRHVAHEVAALIRERNVAGKATVLTRDEAIARGWFGRVSPDVRPRLGDVVAAAHDSWALMSSADFAYEMTLVGLHGSLTPREMHIPILVC